MKTPELDKNVKEKLNKRIIKPSASAWERLSNQLDTEEQTKKKGWHLYIGYAASILLFISIGIQLFSNDEKIIPKEIIVEKSIDTTTINKKIERFIHEAPLEEAIVKNEVEEKQKVNKTIITNFSTSHNENITKKSITTKEKASKEKRIVIAKIDKQTPNKNKQPKTIIKQNPNSRIKISSEYLLYAVTHSSEEVNSYYAKYNTNRQDVLKTIRNQLKDSNFKIDPNLILAEVERTIDDETFQNNFMKSLKKRVTNIANAIASRND